MSTRLQIVEAIGATWIRASRSNVGELELVVVAIGAGGYENQTEDNSVSSNLEVRTPVHCAQHTVVKDKGLSLDGTPRPRGWQVTDVIRQARLTEK
jgi:hypothetical protein